MTILREWLVLEALKEYGQKEILGQNDNQRIVKYFHDIGSTWFNHDEVPWCGAFLAWLLRYKIKILTPLVAAHAWLTVGKEIKYPELGDIVVIHAKDDVSRASHVGLFISFEGDNIYLLGGNQSDQVNIKPFLRSQVISYRRLD